MSSYIVTYDLHGPSRDYDKLFSYIRGLSFAKRLLESVWLVESDLSAPNLRDALVRHVDSNDSVLVIKSGGSAAWRGLLVSGDDIKGHFG